MALNTFKCNYLTPCTAL